MRWAFEIDCYVPNISLASVVKTQRTDMRKVSKTTISKGRGVACDRKFWSLVTASFGRL